MNQKNNSGKPAPAALKQESKKKNIGLILVVLVLLFGSGGVWKKTELMQVMGLNVNQNSNESSHSANSDPDSEEGIEQQFAQVDSLIREGKFSEAKKQLSILTEKYGEKEYTSHYYSTYGEYADSKKEIISCLDENPTKAFESYVMLKKVAVQAFQLRNLDMMNDVFTCGSFLGVPDSEYDEVTNLSRLAEGLLGDEGATRGVEFQSPKDELLVVQYKNGTNYEIRFDGLDKNRKVWILKK